MAFQHVFKAALQWFAQEKPADSTARFYPKTHRISLADKPDLVVSAAKSFKGDPKVYNPEDLLLSSVSSCHMMSYLYCCQQQNVQILAYSDESQAILEVQADGSGRITQIILNPVVQLADPAQKELAISLHQHASRLCFIANSCNFPIIHQPSVE